MIRHAAVTFSLLALLSACAATPAAPPPRQANGRNAISLDNDWKFIREDVASASDAKFDDAKWQTLNLPHTWNATDGEDGSTTGKADYYRGVGWYRKHLRLDPAHATKRIFIKFDGACAITDVYVNGKSAGHHAGMFAAFCFDITELLNRGGDNVIAVKVDNSATPDLPPLRADFTFFGGIYRNVQLLALDPVCISPIDDASSGVYVKQISASPEAAELQITAKLLNDQLHPVRAKVNVELFDAVGKSVFSIATEGEAESHKSSDVTMRATFDQPHLWNGRSDPYLYKLVTTVTTPAGTRDQVIENIGIRNFKADPSQGFFLNDKSYPLHGVNRHQDRPHKGWAISDAEQKEDFDLIMEMGCTGIRLAHYQHAQEFYDLCDRGGLVVWAEACMVDAVGTSAAFDENAKIQLRELIKQTYNHPSIYCWSLFNEIGNNSLKGAELEANFKHAYELIAALNDEAHQLDPTRPTVGASNQSEKNPISNYTDVMAFNRYTGWYSKGDWDTTLDKLHAALPNKPLAISEYGAGASIKQHEYPTSQPKTTGVWHPEEYQSLAHEQAYGAMKKRPWIWGTFLWNMFDFAADQRNEGERAGINDKGMVTYDRKTKKDVFYFYKANWSTEPFVYITDRRFSPRPIDNAPIKVYSNCESVELTVDGQTLGSRTASDHIFIWDNVALKAGDNQIAAVAVAGTKRVSDSCTVRFDANAKIERPTKSLVGTWQP